MATCFRKSLFYEHLLKIVFLAILGSQCIVFCEVTVLSKITDAEEHTDIVEDKPDSFADSDGSKHFPLDTDPPCTGTQVPEYLDREKNIIESIDNKKDTIVGDETLYTTKCDKDVETDNINRPTDENIIDGIDTTDSKNSYLNEGNHKFSDLREHIPEEIDNIRTVDNLAESVITVGDGLQEKPPSDLSDDEDIENEDETNESLIEDLASVQNSTILSWLKYLLDPIIEEFKEGIYTKTPDAGKNADSIINVSSSETNNSVGALSNVTVVSLTTNVSDSANSSDVGPKVKFQCTARNITENTSATVSVVSSSRLLQLLSFDKNETENSTDCLVVMFYAPWCHFCANTAPHYNALARAFPALEFVAVDTAQFSNLLARFGTVSVPNILVFHQSRAAVKFNQTERTFENFVSFVKNSTGLEPNTTVNVTDSDYIGPVSSVPTDDPDYLLWLAWTFVVFYSSCMFVKSNRGQQWIMRVRVLWQEHQHID